MTFGCFALAWIVTLFVSMAEWLRKIQGKAFLFLWPMFGVLIMLTVYGILKSVCESKKRELCERDIKPATISHVDIPHLKASGNRIVALQMKVYYLLRLYLLGVITYKEGMLRVDEDRLKSLMDQGGRHSKIASSILHSVRETGERSMEQVLAKIPHYNSTDDHALAKKIDEEMQRVKQLTSRVAAAALGVYWGVGCAKMALGLSNGKAVGYLVFVGFASFFASLWAYFLCATGIVTDVQNEVDQTIKDNFIQRPQLADLSVIAQLNDKLPEETKRHQILNSYFGKTEDILGEAMQTPEGTFMHDWAATYLSQYDQIKKEMEEEAARKAAESDSSGCSSCSSCSSCGGCGGCGGCGD